jgi:pimeloyl-ACP methyl ester carboxylesterase
MRNTLVTLFLWSLTIVHALTVTEFIDDQLVKRSADAHTKCRDFSSPSTIMGLARGLAFLDRLPAAAACAVLALDKLRSSHEAWVYVGDILNQLGDHDASQFAFDEANRVNNGKICSDYVPDWRVLGPFTIGKPEFDADPVVRLIQGRLSPDRWFNRSHILKVLDFEAFGEGKKPTYFSELVPNTAVRWRKARTLEDYDPSIAKINFNEVDYQNLFQSLTSREVLEWQSVVIGHIAINRPSKIIAVCSGVSAFQIDGKWFAGDQYGSSLMMNSIKLAAGEHIILVPVRGEVETKFTCKFSQANEENPLVYFSEQLPPQVVDDKIISGVFTWPVLNSADSEFPLSKIKLSIIQQGKEFDVVVREDLLSSPNLSPGIVTAIPVELILKPSSASTFKCHSRLTSNMQVKAELRGSKSVPVLSPMFHAFCRESSMDSFTFTYINHDGSIQEAAAIAPYDTSAPCYGTVKGCPVVLTLHGTGVRVSDSADAFKHHDPSVKRMRFGFPNGWLLAPTRHGAHNWETIGQWTALAALKTLREISVKMNVPADIESLVYAGHSMGGHGALSIATLHPDAALCLVPLAGWLRKDSYAHSNSLWVNDIGESYIDSSQRAVFESSEQEWAADMSVSNIVGVPVLTRIGARDMTVHPWEVRRFYRLLQEASHDVKKTIATMKYVEMPEKGHWFWDSNESNDGGVVNDPEVRSFIGTCLQTEARVVYPNQTFYTLFNPASSSGRAGVKVEQQVHPYKKSVVHVRFEKKSRTVKMVLDTMNVRQFRLKSEYLKLRSIFPDVLQVDGQEFQGANIQDSTLFCKYKKGWELCSRIESERSSATYGPIRQVFSKPFVVVIGTQNEALTDDYLLAAQFFVNLWWMTSFQGSLHIYRDTEVTEEMLSKYNMVLFGTPQQNSVTDRIAKTFQGVQFSAQGFPILDEVELRSPGIGFAYLQSFQKPSGGDQGLALVIGGFEVDGIWNIMDLAIPTIPPMTRAPFTHLVPDFMFVNARTRGIGYGGMVAAGFWNNQWMFDSNLGFLNNLVNS